MEEILRNWFALEPRILDGHWQPFTVITILVTINLTAFIRIQIGRRVR